MHVRMYDLRILDLISSMDTHIQIRYLFRVISEPSFTQLMQYVSSSSVHIFAPVSCGNSLSAVNGLAGRIRGPSLPERSIYLIEQFADNTTLVLEGHTRAEVTRCASSANIQPTRFSPSKQLYKVDM